MSKDEWDTKQGTGKSMKDALYVQWYGKRHWIEVEQQQKIKPVTLAIVKLHKSEGINKSVSQKKFLNNF